MRRADPGGVNTSKERGRGRCRAEEAPTQRLPRDGSMLHFDVGEGDVAPAILLLHVANGFHRFHQFADLGVECLG